MDLDALLRTLLILVHLIAFALAAVGTAFCDYAILLKHRIDVVLMHRSSRLVAWALCALWVSGLAVAFLDTGLAVDQLLARPKLLAKLTVVSALSVNGLVLHRCVFPTVLSALAGSPSCSRWPTVVGAISAASWLCALFIGISAPLAKGLGYSGYMAIYGLAVASAVGMSLILVEPRLRARLRRERKRPVSRRMVTNVKAEALGQPSTPYGWSPAHRPQGPAPLACSPRFFFDGVASIH